MSHPPKGPPKIRIKKPEDKKSHGRNLANIDWKHVENLLMAGCKGSEIAANIGISQDTLYERTKAQYGIHFSALYDKYRSKGDSLLLAVQYDMAIKQRDRGMLIWLGKNRLNQSDRVQQKIEQTIEDKKAILELPENDNRKVND